MIDQWLYTHLGITGDPVTVAALLFERGPNLLRAGLEAGGSGDEPLTIEVRSGDGTSSTAEQVQVRVRAPETRGARVRMPLAWQPTEPEAFSTFAGELTFEATEDEAGELALFGRYRIPTAQPPASAMAATRSTARRLLRALAMEIGRVVPRAIAAPAPGRPPRLHVRDLMTPDPVTVRTETPIIAATRVLLHHQVGGVPVVEADGTLVGVLTESDLLAREAAPRERRGVAARQETVKRLAATAGEACTRPPLTAGLDMSMQETARLLLDYDVSRLVVVDGDRVVGMLSRHDVLKALARSPAELQASVDALLEEQGVHGVHAEVTAAGVVRVTGQVRHRSSVAALEHGLRSLDGVTEVRNELTWVEDDAAVR